MANEPVDMRISQLDAAVSVADTDEFPATKGALTKKYAASLVKDYMNGTNDISALGDGSVTGAILNVKSTSETADSNNADTMALNGAHNLLPFPYYEGGAGVYDGISFTFGSDGSVSANGNLANTSLMYRFFSGTLPKGNYRFRFAGSFSGPGLELKTYDATAGTGLGGTTPSANTDLFFTIDENNENHTIWLYFNSDNSSNAVSISGMPILARASDKSNVATPYAMTNRELTEKTYSSYGHTPTNVPNDGTYFLVPADGIIIVYTAPNDTNTVWWYEGQWGYVTTAGSHATESIFPVFKGMNVQILASAERSENSKYIPYTN